MFLLKGSSGNHMNASQKSCHKSPKSGIMCLTKMYPGPCKGAAGRRSISGAAPLQGPCAAPFLGPGYIWSNNMFFPLLGDFDPTEP